MVVDMVLFVASFTVTMTVPTVVGMMYWLHVYEKPKSFGWPSDEVKYWPSAVRVIGESEIAVVFWSEDRQLLSTVRRCSWEAYIEEQSPASSRAPSWRRQFGE
jgi:hypothetical protein